MNNTQRIFVSLTYSCDNGHADEVKNLLFTVNFENHNYQKFQKKFIL